MHAADKQLEEVLRSAVSGGGVRVLEVSDDPKERTIARILTHSVSIGVIRKAMLVVMAYPRDYMPIDRSKYIDSLLFAAETPGKIQAVLQVFPGAPLREKMSQEWTRTYVVTGTRRGSYTDTQEDAGLSTGTQTDHTHTDDTCTHTHTHGQTSGVQSVSIQTSASREAHGCYDDRGTHKSAGTIWEGSGQVVASGSILERDGLRSASTRNTNKVGTGEKTVVLTDHVIGEPLKYG
ncbi:hypothetical protein SARC_14924 [Sphaeroforma arctica JP610]|uniref:Uncharacterized protein n=1 Tax=Sphaeroforma arctica JP610 TaxID=667725 RepID=A0A0L0F797_9EUKA|nr:hypothetical protein SARC_14924 [Sphaeroforma arctica JP610]KNC72519.1 hypothetical protein SARC_14924 [Sphaeroforma arctica JP610]|eukprot:XP_014146421.1 hypothetical protein SARC_14924 [Sphaeroforma arctica JP610]